VLPTYIPLATIEKLLAVCNCDHDKLLVLLAVSTGCRAQEMVKLEKKDFNLVDKMLLLPADITKSKRGRALELRQDVIDLVSSLPEGRIFEGYASSYANLYYAWRRLFWRAELKPVGLHATRRTYATLLHRAGCDQATLKERLGHRSLVTTGRYLAAEPAGTLRELVDAMPIGCVE
jgi:integrase